jgi:5'-methylthioinosine phosphorylase
MSLLGLIGGSGASRLVPAEHERLPVAGTPFGAPSGPLLRWRASSGQEWLYLDRHGGAADLPPHQVNYRANVWLLGQHGVAGIVGLNAVGGIDAASRPGRLVFPDQLVDYTWGRAHSYAGEAGFGRLHVDFTEPFDRRLRARLCAAGEAAGLECVAGGTYAATQGPRLESAAEINRLARDGCTVVGMTGMPEAGLARELRVPYAICALVINWAAGRGRGGGEGIHAEIERFMDVAVRQAGRLIGALPPE